MKIKIKITTGDEEVIRLATKIDDVITYKETPNINVILVARDNQLTIEKTGAINYHHDYQNEARSVLNYIVKMSGNEFEGSSEVTTLKYIKEENKIYLKCLVNGELTKIKWEVMWIIKN